jgi:hypothetical protein
MLIRGVARGMSREIEKAPGTGLGDLATGHGSVVCARTELA